VAYSADIDLAVRRTQPTGPGQRHRQVFELARQLRGLPGLHGARAEDLEPVVRRWWRRALSVIQTQEWGATWRDWLDAWPAVRWPAGAGLKALGAWARGLACDPLESLSLLAEALQAQVGEKPFHLGSRAAARALGVSQSTAVRLLGRLVESGELLLVRRGKYATGKASEYLRPGGSVLAHGLAAPESGGM
jgi:hypothetical protein